MYARSEVQILATEKRLTLNNVSLLFSLIKISLVKLTTNSNLMTM